MENLPNANSRFALDLLRRFSEANPTGNVFFSPVSVSAALAMVVLGAKGNTEAQMLKDKPTAVGIMQKEPGGK
uniref:Serpin domain-containing protein n=1 Tax=Malurus cyaneus samueli TaxID=2593467 RepID=A0A8C5T267_9PASS